MDIDFACAPIERRFSCLGPTKGFTKKKSTDRCFLSSHFKSERLQPAQTRLDPWTACVHPGSQYKFSHLGRAEKAELLQFVRRFHLDDHFRQAEHLDCVLLPYHCKMERDSGKNTWGVMGFLRKKCTAYDIAQQLKELL